MAIDHPATTALEHFHRRRNNEYTQRWNFCTTEMTSCVNEFVNILQIPLKSPDPHNTGMDPCCCSLGLGMRPSFTLEYSTVKFHHFAHLCVVYMVQQAEKDVDYCYNVNIRFLIFKVRHHKTSNEVNFGVKLLLEGTELKSLHATLYYSTSHGLPSISVEGLQICVHEKSVSWQGEAFCFLEAMINKANTLPNELPTQGS